MYAGMSLEEGDAEFGFPKKKNIERRGSFEKNIILKLKSYNNYVKTFYSRFRRIKLQREAQDSITWTMTT